MWYMLLEPKLSVYASLLPNPPPVRRISRRGRASRKAGGPIFGRIWGRLTEARDRRRSINALARLDDRLLRDIGLERGRIPETVDALLHREPAEECVVSGSPGPRKAGASIFGRIRERLIEARDRRRMIDAFARLDDRLLHDIGLERGRIPETVDALLRCEPAPPPSAAVRHLGTGEPAANEAHTVPRWAAAA